MNLKKHLYQYAQSVGKKPDGYNVKSLLNLAKGYDTGRFSNEEIQLMESIIDKSTDILRQYVEEKYPDVMSEIFKVIDSDESFYYCDNFRISSGTAFEELVFNTAQSAGCCGSFVDTVVVNDKKFKIGFNYGH